MPNQVHQEHSHHAEEHPLRDTYHRGGLIVRALIIIGVIAAALGILGLFLGWYVWLSTGLLMSGLCLLAGSVVWLQLRRRG